MAVVVLKVVAPILEHVKVLILHFPVGTSGGHNLGYSLGGQLVTGDPGIMVDLFAGIPTHDGDLAPVHAQGFGSGFDRYLLHPAIGPLFAVAARPATGGHGLHSTFDSGQKLNLLIQGLVRILFAGHNEMHLVFGQQFTKRLMTMQIIAHGRHLPGLKPFGIALHPTFDGLLLAVLLVVSILRGDELRLQSKHMLLSGRYQYRSQDRMRIGLFPFSCPYGAIGAVDLFRGKVLGSIK